MISLPPAAKPFWVPMTKVVWPLSCNWHKPCSDNPDIKHGDIRIVFTPDEEVGKGTARIDMKKLGADFGYTLDGGEAGDLEDETFSADGASIVIHGVISHPGYAKGVMINAIKIAGEILDALAKK
jgi:tripeptide aminopeptidase